MRFSPGLYQFVWYEDKEFKPVDETYYMKYMKRITLTLALNDDNAFENTLRMARNTDKFDNMCFTYSKVSVWLTVYRLITRPSTSIMLSVTRDVQRQLYGGEAWSDLVRYVPAKDKYL